MKTNFNSYNIEVKTDKPKKKDYPNPEIRKAIINIAKKNLKHFKEDGWALDNTLCFYELFIEELAGKKDFFFLYLRELSHLYKEGITLGNGFHYPSDQIPLYLDNKTGEIFEGHLNLEQALETYCNEFRYFKFGNLG